MANAVPVAPGGAEDGRPGKSRGLEHRVEAALEVDGWSSVRAVNALCFHGSCPLTAQPGTLHSCTTRQGRTAELVSKSKETGWAREESLTDLVSGFQGTRTNRNSKRGSRARRYELKLGRFRTLGLESSDVVEDLGSQGG